MDVEPALLDGISALGSGTRVLAVYEQRWEDAPVGELVLYLHGVGDPGNVGTILRGALAFGADCVVIGPGCADPYGGKAVRASMGALFSVPVVRAELAACPAPRVALVARGGGRCGASRRVPGLSSSARSATGCPRTSSPRASAWHTSRSLPSR